MPSCRLTAGAVAKPRRRKSERSINAFLPRTILCLANRHQDAPDRGRPGRPAQGGWVARWASTRRVGLSVLGPVREGGEQGVRVQGRAPNSSNVPGYLAPAEGECGHLARPGIEAFNGRGQGRPHEFPAAGENLRCCRLRRCVLIGGCHRQVIADRPPCPSRTCPSRRALAVFRALPGPCRPCRGHDADRSARGRGATRPDPWPSPPGPAQDA